MTEETQNVFNGEKVCSSAGMASIFGLIQIPTSTLLMTDKEIYLQGFISQTINYENIGKDGVKSFLDWGFGIYKLKVWGKGVKIWSKEAPKDLGSLIKDGVKDLFNKNIFMLVTIKPEEIFGILRQKRPDLFVNLKSN